MAASFGELISAGDKLCTSPLWTENGSDCAKDKYRLSFGTVKDDNNNSSLAPATMANGEEVYMKFCFYCATTRRLRFCYVIMSFTPTQPTTAETKSVSHVKHINLYRGKLHMRKALGAM